MDGSISPENKRVDSERNAQRYSLIFIKACFLSETSLLKFTLTRAQATYTHLSHSDRSCALQDANCSFVCFHDGNKVYVYFQEGNNLKTEVSRQFIRTKF